MDGDHSLHFPRLLSGIFTDFCFGVSRGSTSSSILDTSFRHHELRLGRSVLLDTCHSRLEQRHLDGTGDFTDRNVRVDNAAASWGQDY
jgi:hypothetical protein